MSKGVIYILINPSFEDYVKIGYADDIEKRLQQLNRSECIPFAFRVFATYEVDSRLSDLKIHAIIDKLNPNLRSIDNFNGQRRVREFYAMSPEDAYDILEAIAEINGHTERLHRWKPNEAEVQAENIAKEINVEKRARGALFTFSEFGIPVGATIEYCDNPDIKCTVVDDRRIKYNGEVMYMTTLAKLLSGKSAGVAGPRYFKYKGARLSDVEGRTEDE